MLVAVRNPYRLQHLQRVLEKTDTRKLDIVVLSVRGVTQAASGEHSLDAAQIFADDETNVFTHVVTLAEKAGKHVELMVVPGSNPYEAVVQTAARLQSSRIVMGLSPKLTPSEQGAEVGYYWEQLPEPRPSLSLEIVLDNKKDAVFLNLGPASAAAVARRHRSRTPAMAGTERQGFGSEAASSRHHRCSTAAYGLGVTLRPVLRSSGGCVEGSDQRSQLRGDSVE